MNLLAVPDQAAQPADSEPPDLKKQFDEPWHKGCNSWGSGATGGSYFYCLIQTEPSGAAGLTINRQIDLSLCITEAQLDELRQNQNAINRRRPSFPQRDEWMRENSPLGEDTRDMYRQYDRGEKPYRVGEFVRIGYYGVGDVRIHSAFLARISHSRNETSGRESKKCLCQRYLTDSWSGPDADTVYLAAIPI